MQSPPRHKSLRPFQPSLPICCQLLHVLPVDPPLPQFYRSEFPLPSASALLPPPPQEERRLLSSEQIPVAADLQQGPACPLQPPDRSETAGQPLSLLVYPSGSARRLRASYAPVALRFPDHEELRWLHIEHEDNREFPWRSR